MKIVEITQYSIVKRLEFLRARRAKLLKQYNFSITAGTKVAPESAIEEFNNVYNEINRLNKELKSLRRK